MSNRFDTFVPLTAGGQGHSVLPLPCFFPRLSAQSLYPVLTYVCAFHSLTSSITASAKHNPCACISHACGTAAFSLLARGLKELELLLVSVFHWCFEPLWSSFSRSRIRVMWLPWASLLCCCKGRKLSFFLLFYFSASFVLFCFSFRVFFLNYYYF